MWYNLWYKLFLVSSGHLVRIIYCSLFALVCNTVRKRNSFLNICFKYYNLLVPLQLFSASMMHSLSKSWYSHLELIAHIGRMYKAVHTLHPSLTHAISVTKKTYKFPFCNTYNNDWALNWFSLNYCSNCWHPVTVTDTLSKVLWYTILLYYILRLSGRSPNFTSITKTFSFHCILE